MAGVLVDFVDELIFGTAMIQKMQRFFVANGGLERFAIAIAARNQTAHNA